MGVKIKKKTSKKLKKCWKKKVGKKKLGKKIKKVEKNVGVKKKSGGKKISSKIIKKSKGENKKY